MSNQQKSEYTYEEAFAMLKSKLDTSEFELAHLQDTMSRKAAKKWNEDKTMKMLRRLQRAEERKSSCEGALLELHRKYEDAKQAAVAAQK